MPVKAPAPASNELRISLPQMQIQIVHVPIVGDSPLISHKWSEKAKQMMRDKHAKKATKARETRNPQAEFEDSLYRLEHDRYGFPSIAFKSAAVDACSQLDKQLTKVFCRGAFHIIGEFVDIEGSPSIREDMVRVGMGAADLRYRGEFREWSAVLPVRVNTSAISPEQVTNLFNIAGFAVGVGEWRPAKDGAFGMFHVGS